MKPTDTTNTATQRKQSRRRAAAGERRARLIRAAIEQHGIVETLRSTLERVRAAGEKQRWRASETAMAEAEWQRNIEAVGRLMGLALDGSPLPMPAPEPAIRLETLEYHQEMTISLGPGEWIPNPCEARERFWGPGAFRLKRTLQFGVLVTPLPDSA